MTRLEKLQGMLLDAPDDEFLNYALAMELSGAGRREEALAGFQRVAAIAPQHAAAWFQQAQLLSQLGRTAAAQDAARRGVEAARGQGDQHAVEEISQFLASLG